MSKESLYRSEMDKGDRDVGDNSLYRSIMRAQ